MSTEVKTTSFAVGELVLYDTTYGVELALVTRVGPRTYSVRGLGWARERNRVPSDRLAPASLAALKELKRLRDERAKINRVYYDALAQNRQAALEVWTGIAESDLAPEQEEMLLEADERQRNREHDAVQQVIKRLSGETS